MAVQAKAQVKERPILMSGPMVRALRGLNGSAVKTQTRRVVNPQPHIFKNKYGYVYYVSELNNIYVESPKEVEPGVWQWREPDCIGSYGRPTRYVANRRCPYGVVGDRYWIKETWAPISDVDGKADEEWFRSLNRPYLRWPEDQPAIQTKHGHSYSADAIIWAADGPIQWCDEDGFCAERRNGNQRSYWKSSLFMRRCMARPGLDQHLVSIRAERVQAITEEDAKAEGVEYRGGYWVGGIHPVKGTFKCWPTARQAFRAIWDDLNAKPKPVYRAGKIHHYVSYPWEEIQEAREHRGKPWRVVGNPWVWVLGIKPIEQGITENVDRGKQ